MRTWIRSIPNPNRETKKNKNMNMTSVRQKFSMILLQEQNKAMTRKHN